MDESRMTAYQGLAFAISSMVSEPTFSSKQAANLSPSTKNTFLPASMRSSIFAEYGMPSLGSTSKSKSRSERPSFTLSAKSKRLSWEVSPGVR